MVNGIKISPFNNLQLNLKCENNDLFVSPLMVEVYSIFHSFVDRISRTANNLPSLAMLARQRNAVNSCPVQVPDWYILDSHKRLDQALDEAFAPLLQHVDSVRKKFRVVYDEDCQKELAAKIVAYKEFDTCIAKLDEFTESISEVYGMVYALFIQSIYMVYHKTFELH